MTTPTVENRDNETDIVVITIIEEPLTSERSLMVLLIFQWIMFPVVLQGIDVFGVVANVINIICFVKQGFKDPVNISLVGLAVSDIGCLSTLIWSNICITPAFMTAALPFEPLEFQHLTSGMPHATFTRITAWMTALITLERCLCIAAPFQVKSIITPRRVFIVVVSLFTILIFSESPVYAVNRLGWKFYPEKNKTLLGIVFIGDHDTVKQVSYTINNVIIPFLAFAIIITCTCVLVIKLQSQNTWRKASVVATQSSEILTRNLKVAKMVVIISLLFIACFFPVSIIFIAMSLVPGLSVDGEHKIILIYTAGLGIVLESINSSVNIFVYYHMNKKYRLIFREILCLTLNKTI